MADSNQQRIVWQKLKLLREIYLDRDETLRSGDYWKNDEELLYSYHHSLAQRIRWKWQYVLNELRENGSENLLTQTRRIIDFGCGTGIAHQAFLESLVDANPQIHEVILLDQSKAAMKFAASSLKKNYSDISVSMTSRLADIQSQKGDILLVSHVINELDQRQLSELQQFALESASVIWVEPGAFEASQKLSQIRDSLLESLTIVAPCSHQLRCPALLHEHASHWCHFFAPVPAEVHTSAYWREFAKQCGIDLSSLPLSFFIATKGESSATSESKRVIGHARTYKAFAKVLACHEGKLSEVEILKSAHKELFKRLRKFKPVKWL